MAIKIFLTGVTGYIGGDALYALHEAHPEYEYTLLVRNEERGKIVSAAYPDVKLVYGSLDDAAVIEKAAAEADIVLHTADSSDNVPSARAIAKGIAAGHSEDKPGYWLHTSGTALLLWYDDQEKRYGQRPLPDQIYDDVADIERILAFPDTAIHRDVENIVLGANANAGVRTAIISPPSIYGLGRGPVNTRSMQVYSMTEFLLRQGYAPVIAPGYAEWDNVHIDDLSAFWVLLVEEAVTGLGRKGGRLEDEEKDREVFGEKAFYIIEQGSHVWQDVAIWIAEEAVKQGFIAEPKVEIQSFEEVTKIAGQYSPSWGLNSSGVGSRARKYLGWTPKAKTLREEIPEIVASEAKRLGIQPTLKPKAGA